MEILRLSGKQLLMLVKTDSSMSLFLAAKLVTKTPANDYYSNDGTIKINKLYLPSRCSRDLTA